MQLSSSKAMENSFEENNNTLELLVNIAIMKLLGCKRKSLQLNNRINLKEILH